MRAAEDAQRLRVKPKRLPLRQQQRQRPVFGDFRLVADAGEDVGLGRVGAAVADVDVGAARVLDAGGGGQRDAVGPRQDAGVVFVEDLGKGGGGGLVFDRSIELKKLIQPPSLSSPLRPSPHLLARPHPRERKPLQAAVGHPVQLKPDGPVGAALAAGRAVGVKRA